MASGTVHHLGSAPGYRFFTRVLKASPEAKSIYQELKRQDLDPQPERTQVFNTFSDDSLQSLAISITPFTTKDFTREGGLSVSQGGHAQAVVVDIENRTEITGFTHVVVADGAVQTSHHRIDELHSLDTGSFDTVDDAIKSLAEQVGKVKAAKKLVEIDAQQVRSLASITYNSLLGDDFSLAVHENSEISLLRTNTTIIDEIGLFVLFRTSGSACCSCSCSCWGSSSCSCSYVG